MTTPKFLTKEHEEIMRHLSFCIDECVKPELKPFNLIDKIATGEIFAAKLRFTDNCTGELLGYGVVIDFDKTFFKLNPAEYYNHVQKLVGEIEEYNMLYDIYNC